MKLQFKEINLNSYPNRPISGINKKDLKDINVVTGKNGIGKSTFAIAIKNILWPEKLKEDESSIGKYGDIKGTALLDGEEIFFDTSKNTIWTKENITKPKQANYDLDFYNLLNEDISDYRNLKENIGKGELKLDYTKPKKIIGYTELKEKKGNFEKELNDNQLVFEKLNKYNEEIETLNEEIKTIEENIALGKRLKEFKEKDDLESKIKKLEKELETYDNRIEKINSNNSAQILSLKDSINRINIETVVKNYDLDFNIEKDYIPFKTKLRELKNDYENLRSQLSQIEKVDEKKSFNIDMQNLSNLFTKKENLKNRISELEIQIGNIEKDLQENKEKYDKVASLDNLNTAEIINDIKKVFRKEIYSEVLKNLSTNNIWLIISIIVSIICLILSFITKSYYCLFGLMVWVGLLKKNNLANIKTIVNSINPNYGINDLWNVNDYNSYKFQMDLLEKNKGYLEKSIKDLNNTIGDIKNILLDDYSEDISYFNIQTKQNNIEKNNENFDKYQRKKKELGNKFSEFKSLIADYSEIDYPCDDLNVYAEKVLEELEKFKVYKDKLDQNKEKEIDKNSKIKTLKEELKKLGFASFDEFIQANNQRDSYNEISNSLNEKRKNLDKLNKEYNIPEIEEAKKEELINGINDYEKKRGEKKDRIREIKNEIELLERKTTDSINKEIEELDKDLDKIYKEKLCDYSNGFWCEVVKDKCSAFANDISEKVINYFNKFALGKYEMDKNEQIHELSSKNIKELGQLSSGIRSQLLLATKLAVIETQESDIKYPLFLDESFASCDDDSTKAIIEALSQIEDRQIFYFSPKESSKDEWINALGADKVNVIELS